MSTEPRSRHTQLARELVSFTQTKEHAAKLEVFNRFSYTKAYAEVKRNRISQPFQELEHIQESYLHHSKLKCWKRLIDKARKSSTGSSPSKLVSRYNSMPCSLRLTNYLPGVIFHNQPDKPMGEIAKLIMNSRLQVYQRRVIRRKFQIWRLLLELRLTIAVRAESFARLQLLHNVLSIWKRSIHRSQSNRDNT